MSRWVKVIGHRIHMRSPQQMRQCCGPAGLKPWTPHQGHPEWMKGESLVCDLHPVQPSKKKTVNRCCVSANLHWDYNKGDEQDSFLVSLQLHRQRHWSRRAIICSWRLNNIWVWREGRGRRLSRAGSRWWRCSSTSPGRPGRNPAPGAGTRSISFHIFHIFLFWTRHKTTDSTRS